MSAKVLNDKELEDYYQALFSMHGSRGWKMLMEDFARMAHTHDSLAGVESSEQLWFRKGQLDIIGVVLTRADTCERAYQTLLAEQEGTDEVLPTGGIAKVVE